MYSVLVHVEYFTVQCTPMGTCIQRYIRTTLIKTSRYQAHAVLSEWRSPLEETAAALNELKRAVSAPRRLLTTFRKISSAILRRLTPPFLLLIRQHSTLYTVLRTDINVVSLLKCTVV